MTKKDPHPEPKLLKPAQPPGFFQRLRNNFLTGIVVFAPFAITLYLTWTIVDFVDELVLPNVLPLIPEEYHPDNLLRFSLPGLGLLFFVIFLIAVGSLTKNFFGREIVRWGESWVDRMPVIRSLYNALKQIVETIFSQSKSSFERACLVEYPRRGIWAIAFVSTRTSGEVPQKAVDGREMMSVFLPTTPNPTSGFLLFVPKDDVILLDMTVEEAAKMVISAGLVTPQIEDEFRKEAARGEESATQAAEHAARIAMRSVSDRTGAGAEDPSETPAHAGEAAARNPLLTRL